MTIDRWNDDKIRIIGQNSETALVQHWGYGLVGKDPGLSWYKAAGSREKVVRFLIIIRAKTM